MNYMLTDKALTLFHKNQVSSVTKDSPTWDLAIKKLRENDADGLFDLLNPAEKINSLLAKSTNGDIAVANGVVTYKNQPLPGELYIVRRLLEILGANLPGTAMLNFIENLMQNPSMRAVTELLGFLEYGNLPLTEDGHFLAYKRINKDWKDCHTGTIDNSIGQVVEMPRNAVDDDSGRTCSAGLHFCSKEYLTSFSGARLIAVKINPRDVVSIPIDYNNTKGRCCRYEVVAELDFDPNREDRWAHTPVIDFSEPEEEFEDEGEIEEEEPFEQEFQLGEQVFFRAPDGYSYRAKVIGFDPHNEGEHLYVIAFIDFYGNSRPGYAGNQEMHVIDSSLAPNP